MQLWMRRQPVLTMGMRQSAEQTRSRAGGESLAAPGQVPGRETAVSSLTQTQGRVRPSQEWCRGTAVERVFQEQSHLAGRDVEGLSLAAPAGRFVEDVHALAAGADHVSDKAGAVAAHVLEHGAMRVDDGELLLHTAPVRALQGAGRDARQGRSEVLREKHRPFPGQPPHLEGRSATYRNASLLRYGGALVPKEPGRVSKPRAKTGMWASFLEGILI